MLPLLSVEVMIAPHHKHHYPLSSVPRSLCGCLLFSPPPAPTLLCFCPIFSSCGILDSRSTDDIGRPPVGLAALRPSAVRTQICTHAACRPHQSYHPTHTAFLSFLWQIVVFVLFVRYSASVTRQLLDGRLQKALSVCFPARTARLQIPSERGLHIQISI